MKNKLVFSLLFLFVFGCGYNPLNPEIRDYTSFYGFLNSMDTPEKISLWAKKYCNYTDVFYDKNIRNNALYLFCHKKGSCLHYASLQCYASRWHNKKCGFLFVSRPGNNHVFCWIETPSGITITNNEFCDKNVFKNLNEINEKYKNCKNIKYAIYDETVSKKLYGNIDVAL